jgi:Secretion system C-terminal sorting domain
MKKMKKICLLLIFCTNYFFGQYTLIPDPVFEQNLINQQIDSNTTIDGQVLTSAISSITELGLTSINGGFNLINNLQGIEGFTALEKLSLLDNDGGLTSINLQSNLNLKELYFFGNYLTNVYVSAPLLEILAIENPTPSLQTIDVTNCPMLKNLYCPNNFLTTLDISNNLELEILTVYDNNLTLLDLTNSPLLTQLYVGTNNLTNLNVSQNTFLQILGCGANNLTSLDVSQNPLLQFLGFASNNLTTIDISQNNALQSVGCSDNQITSLNLQNNPELQLLWCDANNLTELNLQNGSNNLLNGTFTSGQTNYPRFDAANNPNLRCILVDDVANCQANWVSVDPASHFVASQAACDNLLSNQSYSARELEVYPNPVSDILTISNHNYEILSISIHNLLGEKIIAQESNKNQIDVSKLASGVYIVSIVGDNKMVSKKIVKN